MQLDTSVMYAVETLSTLPSAAALPRLEELLRALELLLHEVGEVRLGRGWRGQRHQQRQRRDPACDRETSSWFFVSHLLSPLPGRFVATPFRVMCAPHRGAVGATRGRPVGVTGLGSIAVIRRKLTPDEHLA